MGSKKNNRKRQPESTKGGKSKTPNKLITAGLLVAIVIVIVSVIAVSAGGGGSDDIQASDTSVGNQRSGSISPTWIDVQKGSNQALISKSEIETAGMAHFRAPINWENLAFMAYQFDGEMHVRANVCPPCRSIGFSLDGDELVCNSCGTRFEAATGAGISGACKAFPKASVAYTISGDDIVMQTADLAVAYKNTTEAGWP